MRLLSVAHLVPPGGTWYPEDMAAERTYTVAGMTCEHCVLSVREEVEEVAGVRAAAVDLASGRLAVAGEGFSDAAVRDAVAEAGYEVVG